MGFYIKAVRVIAIVFTFVPLYASVLAEEAGFGYNFDIKQPIAKRVLGAIVFRTFPLFVSDGV